MIPEDVIVKLEEQATELKEAITSFRKQGNETGMIDIIMLNITPKIKMLKITHEESDFEKAKSYVSYVQDEFDKLKTGHLPEKVVEVIAEAYDLLRSGKKKEASDKYAFIRDYYDKESNDDLRRLVYPACIQLYKEITESK